MAKENQALSFEYALRDEGENLYNYGGSFKKYGIELAVLEEYLPFDANAPFVSNLEKAQALRIYAKHYWRHVACDDLQSGLDYFAFDSSLVCGGPGNVARWIQLLAFPAGTGSFDEAVRYLNSIELETAISGIEFYRRRRFRASPQWHVLGPEWTNRTNRAKQRALKLGTTRVVSKVYKELA